MTAFLATTALDAALGPFVEALWQRHTASLRMADVGRGARALQSRYLRRPHGNGPAGAFAGAASRAAFALLYAPLHFAVVGHVACALQLRPSKTILDVGCGTGVASAAWALCTPGPRPALIGVDLNRWALAEAAWNWRQLGLVGRTRRQDAASQLQVPAKAAIVAAFCLNELPGAAAAALFTRLLACNRAGSPVLVLEPVAKAAAPLWETFATAAIAAGGRVDEHRLQLPLPEKLTLLRRRIANATELTVRSIALPGRPLPPVPQPSP